MLKYVWDKTFNNLQKIIMRRPLVYIYIYIYIYIGISWQQVVIDASAVEQ